MHASAVRLLLLLLFGFCVAQETPKTSPTPKAVVHSTANPTNNTEASFYCPLGWRDFRGGETCIRLFKYPSNWIRAEETCRTYNGHLVSVRTEHDYDEIKTELASASSAPQMIPQVFGRPSRTDADPKTVWVGLGQLCPRSEKTKPDLKWTDRALVDATFIDPKIVNGTTDSKIETNAPLCVVQRLVENDDKADTSIWTYANCKEDKFMFICEKSPYSTQGGFYVRTTSVPEPSNPNVCGPDPDWCLRNTSGLVECYKIIDSLHYWEDANERCEVQEGADLASIHTQNELEFIANMTNLRPFSKVSGSLWIGLNRLNADRSYRWSDDSPMDYMASFDIATGNWISRHEEDGSCTAMLVKDGSERSPRLRSWQQWQQPKVIAWHNRRCDRRLPAVCKKTMSHPNITLTTPKPVVGGCKDGWEYYDGKCFKFVSEPAKFDDAKAKCEAESANLVSIHNAFEQAYILAKLGEEKQDIWLGMDVKDGRMSWLDETSMKYSRFFPSNKILLIGPQQQILASNPSSSGVFSSKACVFMDGTEDVGYWHVAMDTNVALEEGDKPERQYNCTNTTLSYICETFPSEDGKQTVTDKPDKCIPYGDSCYYFFDGLGNQTKTLMPWSQAQQFCKGLATTKSTDTDSKGETVQYFNLVTIRDKFEWSFVTSHAHQLGFNQFWIGFKENNTTQSFQWVDNSAVHLSRWAPGQPTTSATHKCVSIEIDDRDGAYMYTRDCNAYLPIACKGSSTKPPEEPEKPAIDCSAVKDKGFLPGKTRCYKLMTKATEMTTGYRAQHECFQQWGANLASFPTKEDFEAVQKQLENDETSFTIKYAYIGLVQMSHGGHGWTDKSPVSFMNWADGEPSSQADTNNKVCVQMEIRGQYQWSDVSCWQTRHFICSIDPLNVQMNGTTTQAATTTTTAKPETTVSTKKGETTTSTKKPEKSTTKPTDKPEKTTKVPLKKGESTKKPAAQEKKTNNDESGSGSSATAAIVIVVILVAIVAAVGLFIYVRRRGTGGTFLGRRPPGIMRFDQLSNDDNEF